jgi:hypothetical protein
MSEAGQVASSAGGGTVRRRGAKPSSGAKKPDTKTVRIQLHLGEQTVKRLNVHAALVGRNSSRVADKVLLDWLKKSGKGCDIFKDNATEEVTDPPDE